MEPKTHSSSTCMSAGDHSASTSDYMVHYFGCLEFCQRADYFHKTLDENKKEQIKTELRRIQFIRHAIREDEDEVHLIEKYENSLQEWRNGTDLNQVKKWRQEKGKLNGAAHFDPNATGEGKLPEDSYPAYNPDFDTNARIIMFGNSKGLDCTEPNVKGEFPNQKMQISKLLDPGTHNTSLLHRDRARDGTVRYFHLPTNNMKVSWIYL